MSEEGTLLHVAAKSGDVDKTRRILEGGEYDINCKDSKGNTPLHWACRRGHVGVVKELIKHNASNYERNAYNNTPLHLAALAGKDEVALVLIDEFNCDTTVKGRFGRSLLHSACNGGSIDLVRTLVLKHKADLTARDNEDNTPLHVAALAGKDEVALILIAEFNSDVTVKGCSGRSLLHSACNGGSIILAQTLMLKHGADLTARDNQNDTPLHVAALCGKGKLASSLITEFNCDVTVKGKMGGSLLHRACDGGSVNLVRTLMLKHGADLLARDDNNNTPLHVAALCGKDEVALVLITEFNCDISVKGAAGRSLLHSACYGGSVNLVRTLVLKHGADLTARDDSNDTPLHVAAFTGKDEVALVLIAEFNCDVTAKGCCGRSVLHSACYGGKVNLVRSLVLKHGADLTAKDDSNNTPLHVAALASKDEVALVLLSEYNCDAAVKGKSGKSLLHSACRGGSVNLVRALVRKHGADVTARDDKNRTPLHLAQKYERSEVVSLFKTEFHSNEQSNASADVTSSPTGQIEHNVFEEKGLVYNQDPTPKDESLKSHQSDDLGILTMAEQLPTTKDHVTSEEHDVTSQDPQALIKACKENEYDKVKLLLKKGAEVDLQDVKGWSALMHASHNGHSEVANLLLEYNADIDLQSLEWESALSLALYHGHSDIIARIKARIDYLEQEVNVVSTQHGETISAVRHKTESISDEASHCEATSSVLQGPPRTATAVIQNTQHSIEDKDLAVAQGEDNATSHDERRAFSTTVAQSLQESDKSISAYGIPLSLNTMALIKWRDRHGRERRFRLINMVSAKWKKFGLLLGKHSNVLNGWEMECMHKADRCWCKVMGHWLTQEESSSYPVTWKGLFMLLEDAECSQVANELDIALKSTIQPAIPTAPPATSTETQEETIQSTAETSKDEDNIDTTNEDMPVKDNELLLSVSIKRSEVGDEHDLTCTKALEDAAQASSECNVDYDDSIGAAREDIPVEDSKLQLSDFSREPGNVHNPTSTTIVLGQAEAQASSKYDVDNDDSIDAAREDIPVEDNKLQLSDFSRETGDEHNPNDDNINTASEDMPVEDGELPLPLSINSSSETSTEQNPRCSSLPMSDQVKEDKSCVSSPTTSSEAIPDQQQTPFQLSTEQSSRHAQSGPISNMSFACMFFVRWVISTPRAFYRFLKFCFRLLSFSVWRLFISYIMMFLSSMSITR